MYNEHDENTSTAIIRSRRRAEPSTRCGTVPVPFHAARVLTTLVARQGHATSFTVPFSKQRAQDLRIKCKKDPVSGLRTLHRPLCARCPAFAAHLRASAARCSGAYCIHQLAIWHHYHPANSVSPAHLEQSRCPCERIRAGNVSVPLHLPYLRVLGRSLTPCCHGGWRRARPTRRLA